MVTMPTLVGFFFLIQNEKPVQKFVSARNGKVNKSRFRRPNVSMVRKAGSAKTLFNIPVPIDARRAEDSLYPESVNMVVL